MSNLNYFLFLNTADEDRRYNKENGLYTKVQLFLKRNNQRQGDHDGAREITAFKVKQTIILFYFKEI